MVAPRYRALIVTTKDPAHITTKMVSNTTSACVSVRKDSVLG